MDRISPSDGDDMGSTPVSNTILYWNRKIDMIKCSTCRYSLVVKQILGKDQRTVQFCLSAPLENSVELFRKENTLNRDQSVKRIDFLLIWKKWWSDKRYIKSNTNRQWTKIKTSILLHNNSSSYIMII